MEEPVFAWLYSLLEVLDVAVILGALGIACTAIPYYAVRFRSASSVVGPKTPANLRSFHVHGSVEHVRSILPEFARKSGYRIAHTDELRGLVVLAEKPRGIYFPGMMYSVFLNQPSADQTLVSVGCHSPLAGWIIPGAFPGANSAAQNAFMHRLAAELVSANHPSAPQLAEPRVNPVPAPSAKPAAKTTPLAWALRAGAAFYIVTTLAVFIESLMPPIHETLEVRDKKYWATSDRKSGRVDHYLLLTSSPRWPERYTSASVFERVQKGDMLDVAAAPWSLTWRQVTVQRDSQALSASFRSGWQNFALVLVRLFGVIGGGLFLRSSFRRNQAPRA